MLMQLHGAMLANSVLPSRDPLWRILTSIIHDWDLGQPLPLTVPQISAVGAALRAGGGRSHNNYVSRRWSEAEWANAIENLQAVHWARKDADSACGGGRGEETGGRVT